MRLAGNRSLLLAGDSTRIVGFDHSGQSVGGAKRGGPNAELSSFVPVDDRLAWVAETGSLKLRLVDLLDGTERVAQSIDSEFVLG